MENKKKRTILSNKNKSELIHVSRLRNGKHQRAMGNQAKHVKLEKVHTSQSKCEIKTTNNSLPPPEICDLIFQVSFNCIKDSSVKTCVLNISTVNKNKKLRFYLNREENSWINGIISVCIKLGEWWEISYGTSITFLHK